MKYLLALIILAIPAFAEESTDNMKAVQQIHGLAKKNAGEHICYQITAPKELEGIYCIYFKGNK